MNCKKTCLVYSFLNHGHETLPPLTLCPCGGVEVTETISWVSLNKKNYWYMGLSWDGMTRHQNHEVKSRSDHEHRSLWKYWGILGTLWNPYTCVPLIVLWTRLVLIEFCFSALKICQLYWRRFIFFHSHVVLSWYFMFTVLSDFFCI